MARILSHWRHCVCMCKSVCEWMSVCECVYSCACVGMHVRIYDCVYVCVCVLRAILNLALRWHVETEPRCGDSAEAGRQRLRWCATCQHALVAWALMIGQRWSLLAPNARSTTLADVTNTSLQSLLGQLWCIITITAWMQAYLQMLTTTTTTTSSCDIVSCEWTWSECHLQENHKWKSKSK